MTKYKYVLYKDGSVYYDSYEEYGDDDYEGTFSSYDDAHDAALEALGAMREGADIMRMMGDRDEDIVEADDVYYEIEEIDL